MDEKVLTYPCHSCIYEYEPCGGCGAEDEYLSAKHRCKEVLRTVIHCDSLFPGTMKDNFLMEMAVKEYGPEFVADCLVEMRLELH